jgi:RNA recognition motif-containing protein
MMLRNITYDMKESHFRKEFAKFGKIIDVNVPEGQNGMNRGFAFIEFNSKEEGEKML